MNTLGKTVAPRLRYHPNAYRFLFAALKFTQEQLGRSQVGRSQVHAEDQAHISGKELLYGIRDFARDQFGLMALTVLHTWGIRTTEDFGQMVFELIERGQMRKTQHDQLSDFYEIYDFKETFQQNYQIDVSRAFAPKRRAEHIEL